MHSDRDIPSELSLTGKTAVVTGASSGIGQAIALGLATAGADVLVHAGHRRQAAEAVQQEIESLGRRSTVGMLELTEYDQYAGFVDACFRWKGGVDIWVNNAGADVLTGPTAQWSFEQKLDLLWRVDVQGTIGLSRLAGTRMQSQGGVILNMGWDQAPQGMEGESGQLFGTTKGAIMAFSQSLAKSLAPDVRVNCLAPGWIQTAWGERTSAYWNQRACRESLLGRWGTPQDVARVACFLASPAAHFINGQIIAINGGRRTD